MAERPRGKYTGEMPSTGADPVAGLPEVLRLAWPLSSLNRGCPAMVRQPRSHSGPSFASPQPREMDHRGRRAPVAQEQTDDPLDEEDAPRESAAETQVREQDAREQCQGDQLSSEQPRHRRLVLAAQARMGVIHLASRAIRWQCGNVTPSESPKTCSDKSLLRRSNIASVAMLLGMVAMLPHRSAWDLPRWPCMWHDAKIVGPVSLSP
jgi:hypothetical protein